MLTMKELILIFGLISIIKAFDSISLMQCKKTKACFKTSKPCNIDQCQYIVTWKQIKYKDKAYLEVEMIADVYRDGGYIAMGFSTDKKMGDDGVVACTATSGNSIISIVAGYNDQSSKKNILFRDSEIDQDFIIRSDGDRYGGIFNPNIKRISCRFLRLITPVLKKDQLKDLGQGNQYYLLIARGEGMEPGNLMKHAAGTTVVSDLMIDFTSGSLYTAAGSSGQNSPVAKAHGVIMIVVWICCCGIAIILGRYYKTVWGRGIRNLEGQWFNAHISLQSIGYVLLVIALILIFVHVGGYSKLEDFPYKLHPILGLVTAILFLINPYIALCRCSPKHHKRPIFNWIHFILGTVAHILSIPTIMIGLRLPAAGVALSQLNAPQWIIFFFAIFQFVIEIILEIHSCMKYKNNKYKTEAYEAEVYEYERALAKGHTSLQPPRYPRPSGRTFKLIILGIYIFVAIVVTLVVSILIIVN